jgi:hypothetical protein
LHIRAYINYPGVHLVKRRIHPILKINLMQCPENFMLIHKRQDWNGSEPWQLTLSKKKLLNRDIHYKTLIQA